MAQRGLADWEIALIKRMMSQSYARDKMHAYFNRPERTITPAAFSEIKAGRFGADVPAAPVEVLDRFIERFATSREAAESDPLGAPTIAKIFALNAPGDCLKGGESDHIEFKASFSFQDNTFGKVVRAMAALANNSGGYIICGVEDATGKLLGLSSASRFMDDLARWTQSIKSCLMPMPHFERVEIIMGDRKLGMIFVEQAKHKPVVAVKSLGDKVRSGAIYYRYPGQSAEIGYGELVGILRDRDRELQREVFSHFQQFAGRSPNDLAVIDLHSGELVRQGDPIHLSSELVDQLSIIKEGQFVERDGAPVIRILANAHIAAPTAEKIVRGYVNDISAIRNFVAQETVDQPIQYLLAALNSSSDWLPLFYWMKLAGLERTRVIELVEKEGLTPKKRLRALERISGARTAWIKPIPSVRADLAKIGRLEVPVVKTTTDLRRTMQAIRGLKGCGEEEISTAMKLLKVAVEFAWAPENGGDLQSYVKAAAGRLDEIKFS